MGQIPIPDATANQQATIEHISAWVEFLYQRSSGSTTTHPRDPLMHGYYEDLLNALVYELYLPQELHAAGLRMFERVVEADLPALEPSAPDPAGQLTILREKFEEIYAPTHPLRAVLQKLHTLEPIRIIEGKI